MRQNIIIIYRNEETLHLYLIKLYYKSTKLTTVLYVVNIFDLQQPKFR